MWDFVMQCINNILYNFRICIVDADIEQKSTISSFTLHTRSFTVKFVSFIYYCYMRSLARYTFFFPFFSLLKFMRCTWFNISIFFTLLRSFIMRILCKFSIHRIYCHFRCINTNKISVKIKKMRISMEKSLELNLKW